MDPDLRAIHEAEAKLETNLGRGIEAEQVVHQPTDVEVVVESIERALNRCVRRKANLYRGSWPVVATLMTVKSGSARIGVRPRKLSLDRRRTT